MLAHHLVRFLKPYCYNRNACIRFGIVFYFLSVEVDLQPLPALTFRTIGGVIDMYVFTGPSQESVVQQFTEVVGRPHMPPYWSLGFQLCRYNYNSVEKLKTVIARNRKLGIPYVSKYLVLKVIVIIFSKFQTSFLWPVSARKTQYVSIFTGRFVNLRKLRQIGLT